MDISKCAGLILAAGKGTRMHSSRPKVLQTLLGSPMLAYVEAALTPILGDNVFTVIGHGSEMIEQAFPGRKFILQKEQLGTGHALLCAMPEIGDQKYVLVVNGDAPLLTKEILEDFISRADGCDVAFASVELDDPGEYGRVERIDGKVSAIIEAKDINPDNSIANEINAGIYLLRIEIVDSLLAQMGNNNKSGEYYITDLIGLGIARNLDVRAIQCGRDENLLGINTPFELANMEEKMRRDTIMKLMRSGVIAHAPELVRVSPLARVEPGAEINGPCEIYGESVLESGCVVASHCVIISSRIASNAMVKPFSHLEQANIGQSAQAGPYARLRPGAVLESDAHVGNFVELKKATLGTGSKANHLTYLGDAEIGPHVNIGAGTITCNYDGKHKFQTKIGAHAFIGSNTALVAPVCVGENTLVGAGSVITKDVPANDLAIARARQKNLPRKGSTPDQANDQSNKDK